MKWILLSLVFAFGCEASTPQEPQYKVGEKFNYPEGKGSVVVDSYIVEKRDFPEGATDILLVGKGWYEFTYKGNRYLLRNHGRHSTMARLEEQ